MTKITLRNNFHNTSVTLVLKSSFPTAYQVKKSQKTLCPVAGCVCGDVMGMRGQQIVEIIDQDYINGQLIPRFLLPK